MQQSAAKTVLLTLGRLPVALDIARSFHASGWRVLIAEPWPMHLARMSRAVARCFRVTSPAQNPDMYLAELRAIVADNAVNLVVPVSEESMYVAALADANNPDANIFCMPQAQMLRLHDKFRFIEMAGDFGLRVPATWLGGEAGREKAASDHDIVVKPRYSCSGRNVRFHAAGSSFDADDHSVIQQRLYGEHHSSFSIAHDGKILVTSTYRAAVTDGSVAVCFERVDDATAIEEWCTEFVQQARHTGFISFDFIVDDDGHVAAIECNPRATSGIHFVHDEALATLILGGRPVGPAQRSDSRLTESYSCFTAVLASLFSPREFRRRLRSLRRASDITWLSSDPWPFLSMMFNSWRIVARALFSRHSFAAAAVLDIEWRESRQD